MMAKVASAVNDDLERLSNNELRAACVEYGLPNVPITDTSRKLLIRRLKAAMDGSTGDGKSSTAKGKSRRETINVVTKSTEPQREASPKKPRGASARRTIATPTEPGPEKPTVEVTVREVTNRRRSRTTPVPAEPVAISAGKRKSSVLLEDDEEDDSDVQIVQTDEERITRSSRSPSLAKSKMVTTSYKHVITEEPIIEQQVYKPREVIVPIRREKIYEPSKPVRIQEREAPSTLLPRPTPQLSRPAPQLSRPSLTTSNSNYSTSTTRRYTTSGVKPLTEYISSSSSYKPLSTSMANEAENSEEYDEGETMEAPYLSEFARRLSRLKAEPLASNLTPIGSERSRARETQRFYTTTSIAARRGINNKHSLGESFRHLWIALDRQYGLRKYLAAVAIILVVLFLYIMLVQN